MAKTADNTTSDDFLVMPETIRETIDREDEDRDKEQKS